MTIFPTFTQQNLRNVLGTPYIQTILIWGTGNEPRIEPRALAMLCMYFTNGLQPQPPEKPVAF